jgi:anti-sigma regulatory factor (Ser/Thr protein kinase)
VLDAAELATSELVTNAVKYSGPEPVTVDIGLRDGIVRIDVCDSSSQLPQLHLPGAADESGRGLLIVASLAIRYAVESTPTGKRSWAEFLVSPTPVAEAADASPHPVPRISLRRS